MRVYIYGLRGNMGQRYRAILESLGHVVGGEDVESLFGFSLSSADAVIIATPTATHPDILLHLRDCGLPILCEKPLTKSLVQLETLLSAIRRSQTKLQMVSQYDYLVDPTAVGDTVYDYFRSGQDGLYWDCINVIKHAKGDISVRNESPVWRCMINGQHLNIRDMDHAYVEMIDKWLKEPNPTSHDEIFATHKKVRDLELKSECLAS